MSKSQVAAQRSERLTAKTVELKTAAPEGLQAQEEGVPNILGGICAKVSSALDWGSF